ncbi:hypothetical protein MBLNU13_g01988t2 [Cladosporium sp. NU13]
MADAGGHPNFTPKINPDDHSAKVVLCGALMLPPVTMMTILSIYNRVRSKTLLQVDSLVTLIGIILAIGTYPTFVHATNLGFGKHTTVLTDAQLESVKHQTILAAMLLFFMAQGFVMMGYNMLARKTARSQRFFRGIDALSGIITVWTLANIVMVAICLPARSSPPTRRACLAVVISRLLILPANLFADDWTFTSINTALAFIAEVLFSVMNLLAPSLPVFFDQTSTGGLHFVPGNTPRTTQFSSSGPSQKLGSVDERQIARAQKEREGARKQGNSTMEFSNTNNLCSTSIRRDEDLGKTSFDSDTILVRRSVEIR